MIHPKKESYFALKKILGFSPNNIQYYREALLHKSSSQEDHTGRTRNNERLEFLGDAILDAVVAELVFNRFPDKDEGFLTNTRSKIVKRESLDRIAYDLGLHKIITSSTRTNSPNSHILGNALEAFIGAIYLDQGYEKTKKFILNKMIKAYLDVEDIANQEVNFKSKLLEWAQKHKIELRYDMGNEFLDEDKHRVFEARVFLNDTFAGSGTGLSKKESHQQAAKTAMARIEKDKGFSREILLTSKKSR